MLYFYIWMALQVLMESLPVSSSGHLGLLEMLFVRCNIDINNVLLPYYAFFIDGMSINTFLHVLHAPTALIIAVFFYYRWFFLLRHIARTWHIVLKIILFTGIADAVTAIFFIVFKLYPLSFSLIVGFVVTAIMLYSLRFCSLSTRSTWTWQGAFFIGMVQGISLLPGISRFASVYVALRWYGLPARKAFEIMWLVQWPLIALASMHGIYVLGNHGMLGFFVQPFMAITLGFSTLGAYLLVCWVARLADRHMLWKFSYYMFVPIALWFLVH